MNLLLKTNPPQCEGPEDTPFTNTVRHLEKFTGTPFLVSGLREGDAAAQLEELNVIGLIVPQSGRAR